MTAEQSALTAEPASCELALEPWIGAVRLHTLDEPSATVLGIELPALTGSVSNQQGKQDLACSALCLRPREWLIISESEDSNSIIRRIEPDIDSQRSSLLDVVHGLRRYRLRGSASPWLLAKLSSLDFVGGAGREAHCATTRMGQIAVTVYHHRVNDEWLFDLLVDRSHAEYLEMLVRASIPHAIELRNSHGK